MKGYLPLSEESSISTRGQHLPSIIQHRASVALATHLDPRSGQLPRKRAGSALSNHNEHPNGDLEADAVRREVGAAGWGAETMMIGG